MAALAPLLLDMEETADWEGSMETLDFMRNTNPKVWFWRSFEQIGVPMTTEIREYFMSELFLHYERIVQAFDTVIRGYEGKANNIIFAEILMYLFLDGMYQVDCDIPHCYALPLCSGCEQRKMKRSFV